MCYRLAWRPKRQRAGAMAAGLLWSHGDVIGYIQRKATRQRSPEVNAMRSGTQRPQHQPDPVAHGRLDEGKGARITQNRLRGGVEGETERRRLHAELAEVSNRNAVYLARDDRSIGKVGR